MSLLKFFDGFEVSPEVSAEFADLFSSHIGGQSVRSFVLS
jgi:hypothetical protein